MAVRLAATAFVWRNLQCFTLCAPSFLRLLAPTLGLFFGLCVGVLPFPCPAQADGYVVTYNGVNILQDKGFDDLDDSNPIAATLTWQGSGPAPGVIVEEDADASWFVDGSGTGTCSCGLPNPVDFSNDQLGDESATRYTFYPAPASGSIPLPTVTTSGSTDLYFGEENDNFVNLSYTVEAYPVTITLGGTTKDGSGSDNILIGQGCVPSMSAGPCTLSNFQWNPGGDTFDKFEVASDFSTGHVVLLGGDALSKPSPLWHYSKDSDGDTFTVKCSATATINGTNIGTVQGQRDVQVWVPLLFVQEHGGTCECRQPLGWTRTVRGRPFHWRCW